MKDLVEGMRFDSVVALQPVRRLEEFNWAVEGCLGCYHHEYGAGARGGV